MKAFVLELGKQGGGMKGLVQESIKRRDVVSTRLTRSLNIPRRKVTHYNGNAEGAPNTIQKKIENENAYCLSFSPRPQTAASTRNQEQLNLAVPSTQGPQEITP